MNIFYKLKKFIESIIRPKKMLCEGSMPEENVTKVNEYIDSLQKDTKNHFNKQDILKEIDKNPNIIDSLSYKRLVQLNQLYAEKINELESKIKVLKSY